MNISPDFAQTAMKGLMEYLGLQDFRMEAYMKHDITPKYMFNIGTEIDITRPGNQNDFVIALRNAFTDPLLKSGFMKIETEKLHETIQALEQDNFRLEKRIEELEKFEIYYKMAMKMRHGPQKPMNVNR